MVSTTMFLFESCVYITICCIFKFLSDDWRVVQIPNVILSFMGIAFLLGMPETPRFLVSQKRFTEAREVFKWIGMKNGLQEDEIEKRMNQIRFDGEIFTPVSADVKDLEITDNKNKSLRKQMREN